MVTGRFGGTIADDIRTRWCTDLGILCFRNSVSQWSEVDLGMPERRIVAYGDYLDSEISCFRKRVY